MEVQERHISNCRKADPDYGKGVAEALMAMSHPTMTEEYAQH